MGINNEAYPCDCCQIDEAQFRRNYTTTPQMPCGPSGMMQYSEVRDHTDFQAAPLIRWTEKETRPNKNICLHDVNTS